VRITNATLGIIAGLFVVIILAVVGLEVAGRDPGNVLYLAVAVLVPTVTSIIGIKATTEVKEKTDRLAADVALVKTQTNGTTTSLVRIVENHITGKPVPDDGKGDSAPRHAAV
jgi:hypothetical protein